jgi:hypothetical protein
MTIEDLQAVAVTGSIGAVIGIIVAAFARRSSSPYRVTAVWAFGAATIGGPVVAGIVEAIYRATADGISFDRALGVIGAVAFFLIFTAPLLFGLPGVLAGCAFHWLFRPTGEGVGDSH